MDTKLKQTRFRVEGMDCAGCATKIDTAVRRVPGVEDVSVSVTAGTMVITHSSESDLVHLQKRVTGLGYTVSTIAAKGTSTKAQAKQDQDAHDDHAEHDHAEHDHRKKSHKEEAVTGLHSHGPTTGPWWRSWV